MYELSTTSIGWSAFWVWPRLQLHGMFAVEYIVLKILLFLELVLFDYQPIVDRVSTIDFRATINWLSRLSTIHIQYTGRRNVTAFTISGAFVSKEFQIKQAGNLPTVFCKASTSSSWWWWVLCFRRAWTSSASWTFKSYCCFIWRYLRGKIWGKVVFKPALILHEHIKWLSKVRVAYFSAIFL